MLQQNETSIYLADIEGPTKRSAISTSRDDVVSEVGELAMNGVYLLLAVENLALLHKFP
jgi:hypothetical protein